MAGNLKKFDGRGTFVKITVASLWILICCIKGLKSRMTLSCMLGDDKLEGEGECFDKDLLLVGPLLNTSKRLWCSKVLVVFFIYFLYFLLKEIYF